MMKHTFDVSMSREGPTYEGITIDVGSSPDDLEGWGEVLSDPSDVNDLAIRQLTVDIQGYIRRHKPSSRKEAQALAEQYKRGASRGRKAPTMSLDEVEALGLTDEQVAAMKAKGMKFTD